MQDSEKEELRARLAQLEQELATAKAQLTSAESRLATVPDPGALQAQLATITEMEVALTEAHAQILDVEGLHSQVEQLGKLLKDKDALASSLQVRLDSARQDLVSAQAAAERAQELETVRSMVALHAHMSPDMRGHDNDCMSVLLQGMHGCTIVLTCMHT